MINFISRMKRSFILSGVGSFYSDKDFELVLKYLKRPFSTKGQDEVICNILRIISLQKTGQPKWEIEYDYLIREGFLDVFSEYERNYLDCYLRLNLFGDKSLLSYIDSKNISKKVRKYFPLPA